MHDVKKEHITITNRYRHKQTIVFLQINQHFWKHEGNIIYTLLKINVLIPTIVLRLKKEQRRKTVFTFWGYYQEPNCTTFPWPTIWKTFLAAMTKNTNFIQNVYGNYLQSFWVNITPSIKFWSHNFSSVILTIKLKLTIYMFTFKGIIFHICMLCTT